MKKNILTFIVIFIIVNFAVNYFYKPDQEVVQKGTITLETKDKEFGQGGIVEAEIKNNTANIITIKNECPNEPLEVLVYENEQWVPKTATPQVLCENMQDISIASGEKYLVTYKFWNHALFSEEGRYKLKANINAENEIKTIESNEFEIVEQGLFSKIWTKFFYQPLYNGLIFIISQMPHHDLGLAVILLTIIIRTILLIPSHNALKSQRKMQEIQPKLNKIREKYKDNQEMIAKETMAIWKEHKTNPFSSCLPLLIQFPFLIAIFWVIQNGLNPNDTYLLYSPLKDFNFSTINVIFLNILDLTKVNLFVLPLIVGALQFLQMKLAMAKSVKKDPDKKETKSEMEIATKSMTYIMPVMIAIFTASVPAAVGLYWASSTTYGIIQQLVVNKQSEKENIKVKVIPPEIN